MTSSMLEMVNVRERVALPRTIGILVLPGFSMLAFYAVVEPLRLANQLLGYRHYVWSVYSPDGQPVRASCGMAAPASTRPNPADAPECVIIVAGFDPWPQHDQRLKSWLRALERRGLVLGAADTGAFLLASAGLLNGINTALHWESVAAFKELFPEVPVSSRLFELYPRRLLSMGGSATIDMLLTLMERDFGAGLCDSIARRLMHARRYPDLEDSPTHDEVPRTQNESGRQIRSVMEQHIEEPITIADVASKISSSQRSLERKCRELFGRTPKQVYLDVRLERAREILRHSDLAVRDVAISCGFASIPYFCRAYKSRFRISPGSDRTLDQKLY
jgi:AraC family carnitine catabolism transcriptional activator